MKNSLLILIITLGFVLSVEAQQGIGIGTTTPHSKSILELSSTTKGLLIPRMSNLHRLAIVAPPQGLMVFQNSGTLGFWYHDGTIWQRFAKASELTGPASWTVAGDNQYSNVDGNVGIGTQTPDTKLHILGYAKMSYPSAAGPSLTMETTYLPVANMPNISGIVFNRNGSWVGSLSYFSPNMLPGNPNPVMTPGILRFSASDPGANDLVITTAGTVGIGTSSNLATRLYIVDGNESSLSTHGYMVLGSVTSSNMVFDQNEIQARLNGSASTLRLQQDGGALMVQGGAFIVASSGNVGIGDLTPDVPLDVEGDAIFNGVNPTVAFHQDGVQKGFAQLSGNNFRVGTFGDNDLGSFVVRTNGGDRFFVAPSGNVGIGTSNPLAKLDVDGRIRIFQGGEALGIDGTNPSIGLWHNGAYKFFIHQIGNDLHIGKTGGNSTGKLFFGAAEVAINTSGPAPGYSLSVGGEIICEELRVELAPDGPWPDYVFAEDYALRPLADLKTFISTNKHLPNIPAAAQVEAEGFDVGDMNRRLLEKLEELTLYTIQQQEEIDEMKNEIEGLKN